LGNRKTGDILNELGIYQNFPGNVPKVVHHGQKYQDILNVPLRNISGTLFQFVFSFTGWEHCDRTTGNTAKYTVNEPLGNIMGTFFGKFLGLPIYYLIGTLWSHDLEHCKHTDQFFLNEPLGKIVVTFFGKILGFPMDYLMGTLQSHDLEHCGCTGHFLHWEHCNELAWETLNVFAMYRMGFWWVLYPFPCNVLAVYLLGTPALAPSVRRTIKALENGENLLPGKHALKALENGESLLPGNKALENGIDLLPGTRALAAISLMDLHRCLGHISPAAAIRLIDNQILTGITVRDRDVEFCEVCALAKIKRHPFPKSRTHPAQNVGDVIHTDLWGPAQTIALGGGQYSILFIDEYSRYGVVEFPRTKDESFKQYKNYESWLWVQFERSVKCLQSDRGGEFTGNEFNDHLRERGTVRRLTVHDSPQSNGIAERCNGVLVEHARAMLIDSGLPKYLWKEAVKYSMWIRNRTTTHHLDSRTPYEVLYGIKPEIGDIHLWGSRVWVRSLTAGKLDPRGREGRFVGYDAESKGCRVYWTDSRTVGVERDLIFEDRPMDNEQICLPEPSVAKNRPKTVTTKSPPKEPTPPITEAPEVNDNVSPSDIPLPPPGEDELINDNEDAVANSELPTPVTEITSPPDASEESAHGINPHIRRSTRIRKPSTYVKRVIAGEVDGGTARSKSKLLKGLQAPTGSVAIVEQRRVYSIYYKVL